MSFVDTTKEDIVDEHLDDRSRNHHVGSDLVSECCHGDNTVTLIEVTLDDSENLEIGEANMLDVDTEMANDVSHRVGTPTLNVFCLVIRKC